MVKARKFENGMKPRHMWLFNKFYETWCRLFKRTQRLLVVSMACVVVWEIAAAKGEKAQALRTFLIKLSDRKIAWGKLFTNPGL